MTAERIRNGAITVFVLVWLAAFNYESLRAFYLNPFFGRNLPKIKFLFPPAGWIMFYQVDDTFGYTEVYGIKEGQSQLIDPHLIFETRTIGFDNIHRNVLSGVIYPERQKAFGNFLKRKFPYFDGFLVAFVQHPSVIREPLRKIRKVIYQVQ